MACKVSDLSVTVTMTVHDFNTLSDVGGIELSVIGREGDLIG